MNKIRNIILSDYLISTMKNYGKEYAPQECCGILTGSIKEKEGIKFSYPNTWHPIDNVSPSDSKWDYVMEPNQYMNILKTTNIINKRSKIELAAVFHTHPNNAPIPSQYDIKGASWNTVYLIYGVKEDNLKAYYWDGMSFSNIPINHNNTNGIIVKLNNIESDWQPWKQLKY